MNRIEEITQKIERRLKLRGYYVSLMPWRSVHGVDDPDYTPFVSCSLEECMAVSVYSEFATDLPIRYELGDTIKPTPEAQFNEAQAREIALILKNYGFSGEVTLSMTKKTYNIWRRRPKALKPDGTWDRSKSRSTRRQYDETNQDVFERSGDYINFDGTWIHEDEL